MGLVGAFATLCCTSQTEMLEEGSSSSSICCAQLHLLKFGLLKPVEYEPFPSVFSSVELASSWLLNLVMRKDAGEHLEKIACDHIINECTIMNWRD